MSGEELARRFSAALAAVDGEATVCQSVEEAHDRVAALCSGSPVVLDEGPETAPLASRLQVVDDPWAAQFGVSGVVAAVAETGTLALAWGPGRRRSTPLVPPRHVAVVPMSRLVPTYGQAIVALAALDPRPSGMQMITGPSRSADIEMKLVKGVHGPGRVHVVLYPDPSPA